MKYKISVTDTMTGEVIECYAEHMSFEEDVGIKLQDNGITFEPMVTGQRRVMVKGWTGCESYEAFKTDRGD